MKEKLEAIKAEALAKIDSAKDLDSLNDIKVAVLGKKGELTAVLKSMKDVPAEERPMVGQMVNEARTAIEEKLEEEKTKIARMLRTEKMKRETIDVTLPGKKNMRGHRHPNQIALEDLERVFIGMGYEVVEGPEVEYDKYNFELLNIPANHPAKDEQDTFYITKDILLRTQTSAVQARTMMANTEKTPIRMITAGKTYRREDDATHSHQFNQVEGLVIDKKENNVSLANLKGTLEVFMKKMLGEKTELRFRPSYFPFTEPSYEVDVTCFKCGGKGCPLCKKTGWIEVLGAGMVHPNVLKMNGYDPDQYSGFAFGTGIDRLAMFKFGIPDMRLLYSNDIKFLNQFARR